MVPISDVAREVFTDILRRHGLDDLVSDLEDQRPLIVPDFPPRLAKRSEDPLPPFRQRCIYGPRQPCVLGFEHGDLPLPHEDATGEAIGDGIHVDGDAGHGR